MAKDLDNGGVWDDDVGQIEDEDSSHSISGSKRPASEAAVSVSGSSINEKRNRSSRQVLRDVLDGVVDPEILDSCVEDLELITAHSGNQLCELIRVTQKIRNERDSMAENNADMDAKQESSSHPSPIFSAAFSNDGAVC